MLILIVKFLCLYFGIQFGYVNTAKVIRHNAVSSSNIGIMAAAWAGFITLQWLI